MYNNEIIPPEYGYNIYRHDRQDSYGGVLIAVRNTIPSLEVSLLATNCEILWVKVTIPGHVPHLIGAYYTDLL